MRQAKKGYRRTKYMYGYDRAFFVWGATLAKAPRRGVGVPASLMGGRGHGVAFLYQCMAGA